MNDITKRLVTDLCRHGDTKLISDIVLRMQEEDNVSEVLGFSNCFRAIRNMAAHEPDTLIAGFIGDENRGMQRRVFKTANGTVVILDMIQFAAWMVDMYLKTDAKEYIYFLKALYKLLYPKVMDKLEHGSAFKFKMEEDGLVNSWSRWSELMHAEFGTIIPVSLKDPYIAKLYTENRKVFWKVAIPDMMSFTCFFLAGRVNCYDKENMQYFISLYCARDGGVADGKA